MNNQEVKIVVSRQFSKSGKLVEQDDKKETIELTPFPEGIEAAHVSADCGLTRNLGNFNSAKVGVFCSVPCYPDAEEMRRAFLYCKQFVDEGVGVYMEEYIQSLKSKGVA